MIKPTLYEAMTKNSTEYHWWEQLQGKMYFAAKFFTALIALATNIRLSSNFVHVAEECKVHRQEHTFITCMLVDTNMPCTNKTYITIALFLVWFKVCSLNKGNYY